jgi:hypothetical protein
VDDDGEKERATRDVIPPIVWHMSFPCVGLAAHRLSEDGGSASLSLLTHPTAYPPYGYYSETNEAPHLQLDQVE